MGKYDDILYNDRPVSKNHKQMSIYDRSAQFAPFAALVGYENAIKEAGKKTVKRIELSEDEKQIISLKLQRLHELKKKHPVITVTHFVKDKKKDEGNYISLTGELKTIDIVEKKITISKNPSINFADIIDIVLIDSNETQI